MNKLNLLPPEIKAEIDYAHKNAKLYQYLVRGIACIFAILALMFVIGYIVWNNQEIASQTRSDAYAELGKMDQVDADSHDLYMRLSLIDKIRKTRLNWTKIFDEISASTPTGVRLISYNFTNAATDRVAISGFAATSGEVGSYREQLSKSTLFQYVDVESLIAGNDPADNTRTGFTFSISLTLKMTEAEKK